MGGGLLPACSGGGMAHGRASGVRLRGAARGPAASVACVRVCHLRALGSDWSLFFVRVSLNVKRIFSPSCQMLCLCSKDRLSG